MVSVNPMKLDKKLCVLCMCIFMASVQSLHQLLNRALNLWKASNLFLFRRDRAVRPREIESFTVGKHLLYISNWCIFADEDWNELSFKKWKELTWSYGTILFQSVLARLGWGGANCSQQDKSRFHPPLSFAFVNKILLKHSHSHL